MPATLKLQPQIFSSRESSETDNRAGDAGSPEGSLSVGRRCRQAGTFDLALLYSKGYRPCASVSVIDARIFL
jgi:hypothetical protein